MANLFCLYAFFFVFLQSFRAIMTDKAMPGGRALCLNQGNKIKNHYNERFI